MIIKEPVSNPYHDSMRKFMKETLQQKHAIEVNDFWTKYKSYAEVIIGKKSKEKVKENENKVNQQNEKKVTIQTPIGNNDMLLQIIMMTIKQ